MNTDTVTSRRVIFASRPQGAPTEHDFRFEETALAPPGAGQMLLRTLYLSLDPYMRGRMNAGPSYAPAMEIGDVMVGGTVSEVLESKLDGFSPGDLVLAASGWQTHAISDGSGALRLDPSLDHPSYALGILGMPGFTAYVGLHELAHPKEGETVVVSAATGAVGSVVGQLAKLARCRTVAIAGSDEKCRYAVDELGYDASVSHRADDLEQRLAKACPDGIDIYYENVGGKVQQAVLPHLNVGARIPLCGLVAHYNATELPEGPDRTPVLLRTLLTKRAMIRGFIIFDHWSGFPDFQKRMSGWLREGKLRYREDVVQGLEQAPEAFMGLLQGRNFGKLVVQVAERG